MYATTKLEAKTGSGKIEMQFRVCQLLCIQERLQRRFPIAVLAAVGPFSVVVLDPLVHVSLQLIETGVELLAKGDPIKLLEDSAMKAFADAVSLRRLGFRLRVIDILHGQVQLVLVLLEITTVFRTTVGQDAQQTHILRFEERQHLVVKHVSSYQRVLPIVEFHQRHFGVSVGCVLRQGGALAVPFLGQELRCRAIP